MRFESVDGVAQRRAGVSANMRQPHALQWDGVTDTTLGLGQSLRV